MNVMKWAWEEGRGKKCLNKNGGKNKGKFITLCIWKVT